MLVIIFYVNLPICKYESVYLWNIHLNIARILLLYQNIMLQCMIYKKIVEFMFIFWGFKIAF